MKKILLSAMLCVFIIFSACAPIEELPFDTIDTQVTLDGKEIPQYSGEPSVKLNNNKPKFTDKQKKKTKSFEKYSRLDRLGRCGTAYANISTDLMPKEKRGDISSVHPTGWRQKEYAFISDGHIYNRCHLIGYQLTGENANERNLITGTRYMNVDGMLPYENKVAEYIHTTKNHVLYRVTPVFEGENLLASGVEMEAWSVEDNGRGVCFNVYCYNVQPGVIITYANGQNKADMTFRGKITGKSSTKGNKSKTSKSKLTTFIINKNSGVFHLKSCKGVKNMNPNNKRVYKGKKSELIKKGYTPCGYCLG